MLIQKHSGIQSYNADIFGGVDSWVNIETQWNLEDVHKSVYNAAYDVNIETQWNLEHTVSLTHEGALFVNIETQWNLEQGHGMYRAPAGR